MTSKTSNAFLLPLLLVLAASAFRFAKLKGLVTIDFLENFSPWMALAFTGTLVFPKRVSFLLIPLLLVIIGISATGIKDVMHWEAVASPTPCPGSSIPVTPRPSPAGCRR
jgi:hypothetical protein